MQKKKSPSKIQLLATKSNQHRQRYTRQLNIPIIFHKQHFYSDIYTKWLIIGLYPGLRRKLREREKIREKLGVVCICIGLSCCGCFVFFYVIIGPNWWISINTRCPEFCYLILKMEPWVNTVKAPSNEHKRTWSEFGLILEQLLRLVYIFFLFSQSCDFISPNVKRYSLIYISCNFHSPQKLLKRLKLNCCCSGF